MSQPIVIERTHLLTTIGLLHDTPSLLVPPYYELQTQKCTENADIFRNGRDYTSEGI
jgi:hypothetical protein